MLHKFIKLWREPMDRAWLADYLRFVDERGLAKSPLPNLFFWLMLVLILLIVAWRWLT